ncbi:MAG TPA: hypothetical protein VFM79_00345, partial [Pelobium sp.]|nr:hypothetical protein [Pelobium sp.]
MSAIIKQHPSLYKIVITHYLLAALTFLALAPMLLFSVKDFGGHYFQPHLLAITHTAALGWGTIIIFGACYQLMPVILETTLYSYKLAWFGLGVFYLGLLDFVYSFWVFEPGLHMQCGSLLLLTGICSFTINIYITSQKIKKPDIYQDFIFTACIWLLATSILGALMVFNFRYAFLPKDHLLFLKLHAHAGLGGWFLLLIIGVSAKLLPMFLISGKTNIGLLKWSYYLINSALLLFFVNTYIFGFNIFTFVIALTAIMGVIYWLIYVYQCFNSRFSTKLDAPMAHTLLSVLLLVIAIFILPFIIFYQLKADEIAVRLTTVYGSLLFLGWISSLILGQTFKTLPFIVWTKRSQHLLSSKTGLLPSKLYSSKILSLQFLSYLIFIISFSTGLAWTIKPLIYLGLISYTVTAILYIGNVLIVLFKKQANDIAEHDVYKLE